MKKLSILTAAMVLFISISFANSSAKAVNEQQKTEKKETKKEDKKEVKKVPAKKKTESKETKAAK
jgi:hypothetical protein